MGRMRGQRPAVPSQGPEPCIPLPAPLKDHPYIRALCGGARWTLTAQWCFYMLFPALTDCIHQVRNARQLLQTLGIFWLIYVVGWLAFLGGSLMTSVLPVALR